MTDKSNTLTDVAAKMTELNKAMNAAKDDVAAAIAQECLGRLDLTIRDAKKQAGMKDEDLALVGIHLEPLSADPYIDALLTGSCWRSLRAELPAAVVRVNNIAADRAILADRQTNGFRSDTERYNAENTMAFYDILDERLERVEAALTQFHALHELAVATQRHDDDVRQNDVPQAERRYVRMPQLRWVRLADQETEGFESIDDLAQMKTRARQYLDITQSVRRN